MLMRCLSEADRDWIANLSRSEGDTGGKGPMSEEDESRFVQLVKAHNLPCRMFSSSYGFAIAIYDHVKQNGYQPECIAIMTGYLAFPRRGKSEEDQCRHIAKLLTHTPENAEVLAFYDLEKQREDFLSHCY
jgi:hypothetical protein